MKTIKRLQHTPHLDKWMSFLRARLSKDGARGKLIEYLQSQDERPGRYWSNRISDIMNGERRPNCEVLLVIDSWLKSY